MPRARHGKEVVVTVKNRIGLLFELSKLLSEKGLSILAVTGSVTGDECVIRLVTDDNLRTRDALADRGFGVDEEDVILLQLPHKPGMLRRLAEALADAKIEIHHLYSTALEQHETCLLVLHTANDDHAIPLLSKMVLV